MILNINKIKILKEFSSGYHKRIYGRDIAKKLKMNQKTVSNVLNRLEKEHILEYKKEGKNKYYYLNVLPSSKRGNGANRNAKETRLPYKI